jgi:hypothetical protein
MTVRWHRQAMLSCSKTKLPKHSNNPSHLIPNVSHLTGDVLDDPSCARAKHIFY